MSQDALIVGINRYQYLPDLKAPALDAEAIAQRLEEDGDFDTLYRIPERISEGETKKPLVSSTHPVTREHLEQALEQLFLPGSSQAPDTVLFYFSGHGLPDEDRVGVHKGFLAASDTDPKNPISGLSLYWLQLLLSKSPVRQQIIWLDCCNSGSFLVNVGAANPGDGESKNRCFIASSRDYEKSWLDLNSPYSVLTKALLDGLDPKRLPGRWIDTYSLVDHVNQTLKGELQTPVCNISGDAINLTRSWVQEKDTNESQDDRRIYAMDINKQSDKSIKYFHNANPISIDILIQSGPAFCETLRSSLTHFIKKNHNDIKINHLEYINPAKESYLLDINKFINNSKSNFLLTVHPGISIIDDGGNPHNVDLSQEDREQLIIELKNKDKYIIFYESGHDFICDSSDKCDIRKKTTNNTPIISINSKHQEAQELLISKINKLYLKGESIISMFLLLGPNNHETANIRNTTSINWITDLLNRKKSIHNNEILSITEIFISTWDRSKVKEILDEYIYLFQFKNKQILYLIICVNDDVALAVLDILEPKQNDLVIDNIVIVGCDGTNESKERFTTTKFKSITIEFDYSAMAYQTMAKIDRILSGKTVNCYHELPFKIYPE